MENKMVGSNIHSLLRDERIKQGLSQSELGKRVGVPQQTINRIEQGDRKLEIDMFLKICNALKINKIGNFTIKFISSYYSMDLDENEVCELDIYEPDFYEPAEIIINTDTDPNHPYNKLRAGEELTVEDQKALAEHKQEALKKIKEAFRDFGKTLQDLYSVCEELNDDGQKKVLEHAEMIAKIPEYRKGTTENTEE